MQVKRNAPVESIRENKPRTLGGTLGAFPGKRPGYEVA